MRDDAVRVRVSTQRDSEGIDLSWRHQILSEIDQRSGRPGRGRARTAGGVGGCGAGGWVRVRLAPFGRKAAGCGREGGDGALAALCGWWVAGVRALERSRVRWPGSRCRPRVQMAASTPTPGGGRARRNRRLRLIRGAVGWWAGDRARFRRHVRWNRARCRGSTRRRRLRRARHPRTVGVATGHLYPRTATRPVADEQPAALRSLNPHHTPTRGPHTGRPAPPSPSAARRFAPEGRETAGKPNHRHLPSDAWCGPCPQVAVAAAAARPAWRPEKRQPPRNVPSRER
ncbi:hypothetical protein SAMN05216252_105378 [Actinacidiphila glaucinigra]|uniref:Uncharacterized protein n=1 Tax=Actinacidiphila glaucinigra TaxID=235986 RepID=A0A239E9S9_9ACTN|nr:hypothetical protein SAMN05216252_105378 [Actinacidiphila glaucinigra]